MKKIKYHENNAGRPYDEDRRQLNNWDADRDYGSEYVQVLFRINCPTFVRGKFGCSFETLKEHSAFNEEAREAFTALGWKIEVLPGKVRCMEISKGFQNLYLHPQVFVGTVKKNEVKSVAEAIASRKTFHLELVDLFSTVYDVTDEEYGEMLLQKKKEARRQICEAAKTTRTRIFVSRNAVVMAVAKKIRELRVGPENPEYVADRISMEFVHGLLDELVTEGWLIEAAEGDGIRLANKTEQRRKGLKEVAG